MDASDAIDAYLKARFGIGLERLLSDAAAGVVNLAINASVKVACDPIGALPYKDGGVSEAYQGTLIIEGVTYRLRFVTFTDADGVRFIERIGELEAVRWDVRLVVPKREIRN